MNIIQRKISDEILALLQEPRDYLSVVIGPRLVGKTTLVHQVLKCIDTPYLYVTTDGISEGNAFWISQQWQTARQQLANSNYTEFILIIDEIDKINNWNGIIEKEWLADSKNDINLKVMIIGSSKNRILDGIKHSFEAKYQSVYVPHWSFSEMQEAFDFTLDQYMWYGGYPSAARIINNEKRWKSYILESIIQPTISKDIFMIERIDKPFLLNGLFKIAAFNSGKIVSLTKILNQLQARGNTTTLSNYLKLLDSAGVISGLKKNNPNASSGRSSIPKFQVYNNAITNALRNEKFKTAILKPILWNNIIESSIGAHLLNAAQHDDFNVEYWRERNMEVDFVLTRNEKVIGIEISSNIRAKYSGVKLFQQKYSPSKVLKVGDEGIPVSEFLKMNPIDMFV